ncbi:MAG: ABC transporter ATP-binding protein [bacterium]
MKPTNQVIKLENISKIYKTAGELTEAITNINLEINQGEFVAIMGPSGSGKSTLMHILGLLDTPTSGKYYLDGKDVSKLSGNKQAKVRNTKIGFVFQQFNLLPRTTVLDNVILPTLYGDLKGSKSRAKELIKEVGLEDRISHKSNELSGGQIQRVAIARALVMSPSVIMADEPTGNLDTKRSQEIMAIFKKINQNGATIVLITHEEDIAKYADRIIRLRDGQIIN